MFTDMGHVLVTGGVLTSDEAKASEEEYTSYVVEKRSYQKRSEQSASDVPDVLQYLLGDFGFKPVTACCECSSCVASLLVCCVRSILLFRSISAVAMSRRRKLELVAASAVLYIECCVLPPTFLHQFDFGSLMLVCSMGDQIIALRKGFVVLVWALLSPNIVIWTVLLSRSSVVQPMSVIVKATRLTVYLALLLVLESRDLVAV